MKDKRVTIRFTQGEYKRLSEMAKHDKMTVSEILRKIVDTYPQLVKKAQKFDLLVEKQILQTMEGEVLRLFKEREGNGE